MRGADARAWSTASLQTDAIFLSSADASDWPLIGSGLLGPVTLTAVTPMPLVVP
jgi:hypothetical protein